jgi:hypothetical protein
MKWFWNILATNALNYKSAYVREMVNDLKIHLKNFD